MKLALVEIGKVTNDFCRLGVSGYHKENSALAMHFVVDWLAVAVLGKNIWGAWPVIIWEATTAKRNLL